MIYELMSYPFLKVDKMEAGTARIFTKDKKECLIAFICRDGHAEKVRHNYEKKGGETVLGDISDVYFLDVRLAQILNGISDESVLSCGASVKTDVESMNGGGVIGDPFSKSESAEDGIEKQKNGLWCIAYSGRFGCAFEADDKTAEFLFQNINRTQNDEIKEAIRKTEILLSQKCRVYIIISDGSGNGAIRYVLAADGEKKEKQE